MFGNRYGFFAILLSLLLVSKNSFGKETLDFDRDILPILSDRCFLCHGPDAGTNESGLRLDSRDEAIKELPSGEGFAIVPSDPEASAIINRILSDDPDLKMPPDASNLQLSLAEKEKLKTWVEQGAEYKQHWAFEPLPSQVKVPEIADSAWPKTPVDQFVLSKLTANKLQPSPEAERWRWLRRISFHLTGLPPTVEQIDQFLADQDSNAYEKVVDRLLNSKQFGEHMAVPWLDAARYADSYGYQSDQLNTQWPYRDWVVRAINENLPYDKFLMWQLAGDLLTEPTKDQRLATAFNRLHRMTNEGGAVPEEWRIEGVSDRVHTFGTVMLGLTLECSRCHDHKYDPISMRDYYSISAFFNSIDENGLYDHANKVPSPTMLLPTDQQKETLALAQSQVAEAEAALAKIIADKLASLTESGAQEAEGSSVQTSDLLFQNGFDIPYDESIHKDFFPITDVSSKTDYPELVDVVDCTIPMIDATVSQRRAIKLDGERGIAVPGTLTIDRWTPFSVVITLQLPQNSPARAVIAQQTRGTDAGYNGWDLTIEDGYLESRLYRVWPGNGIGVRSKTKVEGGNWIQLAATYDGSSHAEGLKLIVNGEVQETTILRDRIVKSATASVDLGGKFILGQRFRSRGLVNGLIDDLRIYGRDLSPDELKDLASGISSEDSLNYQMLSHDEDIKDARTKLMHARKAVAMAEEDELEVPIMEESPEPRETHVLARGQYDAPRSPETLVGRDTFQTIEPHISDEHPRDRLGLAMWATDPNHPLTARVAVNRIWANFFGSGLVETPENFGRQGSRPTNQALLDWLARDFVDHGWDVKHTCKMIALSATYRQESRANQSLQESDPTNALCARGPAHRLDAESIRDTSLYVAGLLNQTLGGPPVSPYQAGGNLWQESNSMSPAYQQSVGPDLYRRSLYSVWKRTAPLPNMMAFDSATREVCTVKRSRTNTPLQALVLLNDTQFIEACRVTASKSMSFTDLSVRIRHLFRVYCSREATDFELNELVKLFESELKYFSDNFSEAEGLLSTGDFKTDEEPCPEIAAMTVVCLAVQNLDAAVWLR